MSTIYVIRHGQAWYPPDTEPTLSDLGVKQARMLGSFLGAHGRGFDAIYVGPRTRQLDTAAQLIAAGREMGVVFPDAVKMDHFDEYHAQAILKVCVPRLAGPGSEWADLFTAAEKPAFPTTAVANADEDHGRTLKRRFAKFFDAATQAWIRGELDSDGVEPFQAFVGRVRRGIVHVMEREGRGRSIGIVTSAGPVSVALMSCLGLTDEATLKVAAVVLNTSLTELKYRDGELTLVGFNAVPHLSRKELIT